MNDSEFLRIKDLNEQLISNVTGNILASDYIPFLNFFFQKAN